MTTRSILVNVAANVGPYVGPINTASGATARFSAQTATMNRGLQGASGTLRNMGAEAGLLNPKLAGAAGLAFSIKSVADSAIGWESAFAGVRKTVTGTEQDLAGLEQGLRDMSKEIPTTAVELAGIAESAGQLGIQTDNVEGFTRVIADLGETTNLVGQEGATQLARFANITRMSQGDFDRLGSTVVDLGNNFATTESEIVDMGLRIAGAGAQVGMAESDILGVATALSSVGIEAEAGGSAISRVMIEIASQVETGGDKLDQFAEVAGMSASEFSAAWREDAAGALVAFITGLGNMEAQGGSTLQTLEELGITEIRMRDALLRSAGAGDLLAEAIGRGNDAWEDSNALQREAAQRYGTTAAQIDMAKNALEDLKTSAGNLLLPDLGRLARGVTDLLDPSRLWDEFRDRVGDPFRLGDEDLMSPGEVWGRLVDDMPMPIAPWIRNRLPGGTAGAAGETEETTDATWSLFDALGSVDSKAAELASAGGRRLLDWLGESTAGQEDLEEATRGALAALNDQARALHAQIDPLFGAVDAVLARQEAEEELTRVRQDSEASAQDLERAERDAARAHVDAAIAVASLIDENGNLVWSTDEVIRILGQMGIPPEKVKQILDDILMITGELDTLADTDPVVVVTVKVNRTELDRLNAEFGNVATGGGMGQGGRTVGTGTVEQNIAPSYNGDWKDNIPVNHRGGFIAGPAGWAPGLRSDERLRILQLGETVIPAGPAGASAAQGMGGRQMFGDVTIQVTSTREAHAAVDELRALERELVA